MLEGQRKTAAFSSSAQSALQGGDAGEEVSVEGGRNKRSGF